MQKVVRQRWVMLVRRVYARVKSEDTSHYWRRSFLKITVSPAVNLSRGGDEEEEDQQERAGRMECIQKYLER
jgi:hypothetical protein